MKENSSKMPVVRCSGCKATFIPPKYACTECGGNEFEDAEIDGIGKLRTFTTIRVPPSGFEDQAPYLVGVIELSNGLNLTARLEAKENVEMAIGSQAVFIKKEEGAYWFSVKN